MVLVDFVREFQCFDSTEGDQSLCAWDEEEALGKIPSRDPLIQALNKERVHSEEKLKVPVMGGACLHASLSYLVRHCLGDWDNPRTEETVSSHQMQFLYRRTFLS